MDIKKLIFVLLTLISFPVFSYSQMNDEEFYYECNKNIKLEVDVVKNGADYFVVPSLRVLSESYTVKIHKLLKFGDDESSSFHSGYVLLQKRIGLVAVNIKVDAPTSISYDQDYNEWITFDKEGGLNVKLDLKYLYPLEIGEYRVLVGLKVICNGKEINITSDWEDFKVNEIPKGGFNGFR